MEKQEAQSILLAMLNGIDPVTGEILPEDHFLNAPDVQEALLRGIQALRPQGKTTGNIPLPLMEGNANDSRWIRKNGKLNAGRPWTEEDHQMLKSLMTQNVPVEEIARRMTRRVRGVMKEMQRLSEEGDNRGKVWQPEQEALLCQLYTQGESLRQIAQVMKRSEKAIEIRLMRLGLLSNPEEMNE